MYVLYIFFLNMTLVDALSEEIPPELVPEEIEEVDSVESNLKIRPRRRRRQKVDVVPVGKKPPLPATRSSPPTAAPVQQVPEVANEELKNLSQELEKVRLNKSFFMIVKFYSIYF